MGYCDGSCAHHRIDHRRSGGRLVLVVTLTFAGVAPLRTLLNLIATSYALKVGYEVIATPLTYVVIHWLKSTEGADVFDREEDFNPFSFANRSQSNPLIPK